VTFQEITFFPLARAKITISVSSNVDMTEILKVDPDFLIPKLAKSSTSVPSSIWSTSVVVVAFLEVFEPDDDGDVVVVVFEPDDDGEVVVVVFLEVFEPDDDGDVVVVVFEPDDDGEVVEVVEVVVESAGNVAMPIISEL